MIKSRLHQDVFSDFPVAFFPVSAHDKIFFLHLIDVVTDAVYCDVSYGFGCFFWAKTVTFRPLAMISNFGGLSPALWMSQKIIQNLCFVSLIQDEFVLLGYAYLSCQ